MLLFQLPPRQVQFQGLPSNVVFPANVTIKIVLNPAEYFGVGTFTTFLREFPPKDDNGLQMMVNVSQYEGIGRPTSADSVSFERFHFDGNLAGCPCIMDGNVATVSFACMDETTLCLTITDIIHSFAASFSSFSTAPISISEITGKVGNTDYIVKFRGLAPGATPFSISGEIHDNLRKHMAEILPFVHEWPLQIVSSARYLSQSFLLESVSKYSYHFVGERILNVCKAVEALTLEGGPDVDHMRTFLGSWGVHSRFVAIFVSTRYLRSQLDSAHIAYSPLSEKAYEEVNNFLPIAERCTQMLLLMAIKRVRDYPNTYKAIMQSTNDPGVIQHLAKYHDIDMKGADLTKA